MKKVILPICAVALLSVGFSSVASASTGTLTKEEVKVQQDMAKKEAAMKEQSDMAKKEAAVKEQSDMAKKEAAMKEQSDVAKKEAAMKEQNDMAKKEAAIKEQNQNGVTKQAVKGEKLPNTASSNVDMMALSACLVGLGALFGLTRRNIKA